MGQIEWAASWALEQRCWGWLGAGPKGTQVSTTVAVGWRGREGQTGAWRSVRRHRRLVQARDVCDSGWTGCGYGQKGTMSGCRHGWPGDRYEGMKNTVEDSQTLKAARGSCTSLGPCLIPILLSFLRSSSAYIGQRH